MSRGNKWVPLDKNLSQEFKYIKREFSMIEAMFSYQLDIDNGIRWTIAGYSKLWRWSRNKVRRFLNCTGTVKGHIRDSKRTDEGHPIHLIDLSLNGKKDRTGTDRGQVEDTTIEPKPKPEPKEKKKIKKKSFSVYLQEKIIQHDFVKDKDKIFEFYNYRMEMPVAKRYKTEKGIDGLISDLIGCRENGLIIFDCIEKTMQRNWQAPDHSYFNNKKGITKGITNGKAKNLTGKDTREPVLKERLPDY